MQSSGIHAVTMRYSADFRFITLHHCNNGRPQGGLSPNMRQVFDFAFALHAAFGTPSRAARTNANTALAQRSLLSYPHFRHSASARPMFDARISAPNRGDLDSYRAQHRSVWERAPDQVWGRLCARSFFASSFAGRPAPTEALARTGVQHSCSTGATHRFFSRCSPCERPSPDRAKRRHRPRSGRCREAAESRVPAFLANFTA